MKSLVWCLVAVVAANLQISAQSNPSDTGTIVQRVWESNGAAKLTPSLRIDGGGIPAEKYGFYWETRLEPPTPVLPEGFSTRATSSSGTIHRVLLDQSGATYFGYDVQVEVLPENNSYRVTFQPLKLTPLDMFNAGWAMGRSRFSDWLRLPNPSFPPPQTVHSGEVLAFTLLTNGATGQKVIDYVTIQEPSPQIMGFQGFQPPGFQAPFSVREFSFATGPARDFQAGDVELHLQSPRLSINGKLEVSSTGDVTGAAVWFAMGKRGRYILSLVPHPDLGFRKIGEVRGTVLSFTNGSDTFNLNASPPIAPGAAAFNLYVLHEPAWRPSYANADLSAFSMGATDKADTLIGK